MRFKLFESCGGKESRGRLINQGFSKCLKCGFLEFGDGRQAFRDCPVSEKNSGGEGRMQYMSCPAKTLQSNGMRRRSNQIACQFQQTETSPEGQHPSISKTNATTPSGRVNTVQHSERTMISTTVKHLRSNRAPEPDCPEGRTYDGL